MSEIGWNMVAYMGMRASEEFELLSHNMANASTPGFKQELLTLWRLEAVAEASDTNETPYFLNVRSRDYTQGSLHETGNETDFALDGPGFFKVQTPEGVRYTRNGIFQLNADRQLVTREGYLVMGKSGPISLNSFDQNYYVDPEGGVHMDKSLGDQITVVDFLNPQGLIQAGKTFYEATPESGQEIEPQNTKIRQREIEESNFDPTAEMVQLINIQRSFEAYLKVMDTFTTQDRKVIEEIGTPV